MATYEELRKGRRGALTLQRKICHQAGLVDPEIESCLMLVAAPVDRIGHV